MTTEELNNQDKELIKTAIERNEKVQKIGSKKVGDVGCILTTKRGNTYFGISAELYCGIGDCAERSAILNMLSNGETEIDTIVAVRENKIFPPCGVCREMILEVNKNNLNTNVLISKSEKVKLRELLPHPWQEVSGLW
jgi:cytidine deaminase